MARDLTPAVERIFAELASRPAVEQGESLLTPQLLLGLLNESECRAALILARNSISEDDVMARWPELAELQVPATGHAETASAESVGSPGHVQSELVAGSEIAAETELQLVMATAAELLADFPQPQPVATEHLLLGLVAGDLHAGRWLREQGVEPAALVAEFRAQLGIDNSPLSVDWADESETEQTPPAPANATQTESPAETRSETSQPENASNGPSTGPSPGPPPAEEFEDEIAAYLGDSAPGPQQTTTDQPGTIAKNTPSENPPAQLYRALDAAANRASEGLRVLEDVARFLLNDLRLTSELKNFRHALAAVVARFPQADLLTARDVPGDVGTPLTTVAETRRHTSGDLLSANFHRVQESLRSLEEFSKLVDGPASAIFKQLRYQSYALHRTAMLKPVSQQSLATARLYVLIDGGRSPQAFEILSRSLIDAGVPLLQLRDKQLNDRGLLNRAAELVHYAAGTETRVIINDRPDIAAAVNATGVHVGQEELPAGVARGILNSRQLLGISTHTLDQARQAAQDGADYLGVGPTFPSSTKQFTEFPGLAVAQYAAAEISQPAYAIGGITLANLDEVLQTGIHGVAVSSAIARADDPPKAAQEFLRRLS